MLIGLLNFKKDLDSEVKKLLSILEPEKIHIGRRDSVIEDFCHWNGIPVTVLGTRKSLHCQKCEEVIDNSDFVIICGTNTNDHFDYSIEYCRSKRKDFAVFW